MESDWACAPFKLRSLTGRLLTGSLSLTGRAVNPRGGPVVFVARAVIVDDDRVRARAHLAATRPKRAALPGRHEKGSPISFPLGLCVTDCGEAPRPLIRTV